MNSMTALYNLDAREIWIKGDITEENYDDNVKCENKPLWADFIAEVDELAKCLPTINALTSVPFCAEPAEAVLFLDIPM